MNVLYDYQILILQKYGGISRYFYEVMKRLNAEEGVNCTLPCVHSVNHYFGDMHKEYPEMSGRKWGLYNRLNRMLSKLYLRDDTDIVHPTYYDPYFIEKAKKKNAKIVFTVYDCIHEVYRGQYPGHLDETDINRKKLLIKESDHILAISESTKRDILKFYPDTPERKISVTYLAASEREPGRGTADIKLPDNFVLFVGQRRDYKNFNNFYKAMEPLMEKDKSLYLVALGGGAFSEKEEEMMKRYRDRIIQKNVTDELLYAAYAKAGCFVFPSMYEGFGIPTLEAFGCGCPVVLGNTSSMPEVGGDAAEYIDPADISSISEKIEKVIYNAELRAEMKRKGYEQAKRFSWDRTAEETLECYKKTGNGAGR